LKFYQKHKMSNYLIGQASPSPLLSPLWTRQYEHNTASMGDPYGRDLNPADLAVVDGRVSLFLPPPYRQGYILNRIGCCHSKHSIQKSHKKNGRDRERETYTGEEEDIFQSTRCGYWD
jgi:hypothetical protein